MNFQQEERLRPQVRGVIVSYAREMVSLLADSIESIAVYGSVLTELFVPGKSNINLLAVLRQIDVAAMKKLHPLISKGARKNVVPPLLLTRQHIASSLDVFPIEFSDIGHNHLTIYGEDAFRDLEIDKAHLRLQCERELKGKLIHLRQGYLESTLRGASLKLLLEDSLRAVLPILRAALFLCGGEAPAGGEEAVKKLAALLPLDRTVFLNIIKLREQKKGPPPEELEVWLANYLIQLQKLAQFIDQMEVS